MSGKSGLGRGLGSLIPEDIGKSLLVEPGERIEQISLDRLTPNPSQPRTVFDEDALQELASSIRKHGIIQPLVVSPHGKSYVIIAGERRWRAAQRAKITTVPVLVRTTKDIEKLELAIIENVQRVDLSPMEQAVSIARLHEQFNLNYAEIGKRIAKAETTVSNIIRLLQLPEKAQQALRERRISEGHARQILALKDVPEKQTELLDMIIRQGWSVRQAERFVSSTKAGFKETKAARSHMATETADTKKLSKRYGTKVTIYRTAKGGRLEMAFQSDDDLQRLLGELS